MFKNPGEAGNTKNKEHTARCLYGAGIVPRAGDGGEDAAGVAEAVRAVFSDCRKRTKNKEHTARSLYIAGVVPRAGDGGVDAAGVAEAGAVRAVFSDCRKANKKQGTRRIVACIKANEKKKQ